MSKFTWNRDWRTQTYAVRFGAFLGAATAAALAVFYGASTAAPF